MSDQKRGATTTFRDRDGRASGGGRDVDSTARFSTEMTSSHASTNAVSAIAWADLVPQPLKLLRGLGGTQRSEVVAGLGDVCGQRCRDRRDRRHPGGEASNPEASGSGTEQNGSNHRAPPAEAEHARVHMRTWSVSAREAQTIFGCLTALCALKQPLDSETASGTLDTTTPRGKHCSP